jgi:uncharacterized cupredoxin-like copper-binding protein
MYTKSRSLLVLFAAVVLITAACGRAPADSVGIDVPASDVAIQEDADHAEEADHIQPSGDADRVVEVELTEFAIAAHSFEFTPGETVEFIITNSGVVEHEFRLSSQGRVDEHLAGGHADHDEAMSEEEMAEMMDDGEAAGVEDAHEDEDVHEEEDAHEDEAVHEVEDAALTLGAGETGTLVFTFPDNDHDFTAAVCLIPGHYEAGMAADLQYAV